MTNMSYKLVQLQVVNTIHHPLFFTCLFFYPSKTYKGSLLSYDKEILNKI